jgi:hypothetical protein
MVEEHYVIPAVFTTNIEGSTVVITSSVFHYVWQETRNKPQKLLIVVMIQPPVFSLHIKVAEYQYDGQ